MFDELREAAISVFEKHGIGESAIGLLSKRIAKNEALTKAAIRWAAQQLLHFEIRMTRKMLREGGISEEVKEQFGIGDEAAMDAVTRKRSPGDWPLWNNTPLRVATKEEIEKQIEIHDSYIRGNQQARDFLSMVAAKLKKGQKVSERLSESEIQRLYDSVYKADKKGTAA